MMSALAKATVVAVAALPLAPALVAAQPGSPPVHATARATGPLVQLAAFGDGPPTGAHRGRRSRSGDVPKGVEPSHADLHGATREDADKVYRKKYGF